MLCVLARLAEISQRQMSRHASAPTSTWMVRYATSSTCQFNIGILVHHGKSRHDVPAREMGQNDRFSVEAAASRWLQCRQGRSSSPCGKVLLSPMSSMLHPTYSYVGHDSQEPHSICQRIIVEDNALKHLLAKPD